MSLTKCAEARGCGATYNSLFYLKLSLLSLLILFGGLLNLITTGDFIFLVVLIGIAFLLLLLFWFYTPTTSRSIAFAVFIIFPIFILSAVVPEGKLMYTNGAYEIVSETKMVSPFVHERPLEIAPLLSGGIKIKNEPIDWSVTAMFRLEPETRLRVEDLENMRLLISNGVEIPTNLLSADWNPKIAVEDFLIEKYPYLRFEVVVRKFTVQTWK